MAGGLAERSKELFRKYGRVALGVHFTVYFSFLAGCYIAIDNHVDVRGPLQKIGLLSKQEYDDTHAAGQEGAAAAEGGAAGVPPASKGWMDRAQALTGGSSTLALAFLCNKALFPVRTPITLALTPYVARILRIRAAGKLPSP